MAVFNFTSCLEELLPPLFRLRYLEAVDLFCEVWCVLYASRSLSKCSTFQFLIISNHNMARTNMWGGSGTGAT